MRACFLGQNVTALGYGVAMLQAPPLAEPQQPSTKAKMAKEPTAHAKQPPKLPSGS